MKHTIWINWQDSKLQGVDQEHHKLSGTSNGEQGWFKLTGTGL
jgi:hypothetical protein